MTLIGYVLRDLLRNPRRTLTSLVGVIVGVGLFAAVLFFIDGSGASMTRRALAPLTLDTQLVLTSPLGGGILLERTVADSALSAGAHTVVTLTVVNSGVSPAHEVVIRDRPDSKLSYLPGSTLRDGTPVEDVGGGIPLYQGNGGIGLNIGTVAPGSTHQLSYRVEAKQSVPSIAALPVQATISSREAVTPAKANPRPARTLQTLGENIAHIPGVRAADPLVSVDMESGALSANGSSVQSRVKLFAFNAEYQAHYPSIRTLSGRIGPDGVAISAETARALNIGKGGTVNIMLPGGAAPLVRTVVAITDLSNARPLFESRESSRLEKFVYVPFTVIVDPATYRAEVAPAFEAAAAARAGQTTSVPLEELDISLDRSTLNADPATAVAQTRRVAQSVLDVAGDQGYLIDNISNTLLVARGDAAVAKRLFVFLGVPGAILAAILTAYAGTLLAGAQRRENALLRVRGAARRHLLYLLALRTIAIAGIGSLLGAAVGFLSVLALLGGTVLFEASAGALLQSAAIGAGGGMLVTALALYVPGRRLIASEIKQELSVVSRRSTPLWRRLQLDVVVLVVAVVAQLLALQGGAFDAPAGSVYAGQSISLPLQLLIAPLLAWLAGTVLISRILEGITSRAASSRRAPGFTSLLSGVLWRSITRRLRSLAGGVAILGLVVSLGTMLTCFTTVYDKAQSADARFLVGSDIRLTPNPTSVVGHPISLSRQLGKNGATTATAVVFSPQNAVLTSDFNEDVATLAAIDPRPFSAVAPLRDSAFVSGSAARLMSQLDRQPDGILVNSALATGLKLKVGDKAEVLLARGTDAQTRRPMKVIGLFTQFPGAPKGTDIVANLTYYQSETRLTEADYYLVHAADGSGPGIARVLQSLSSLEGFHERFDVQTSRAALNRDQSSLTALNVRGLLQLDSIFTFLMAATATAMFVFGLLMQRRREYVTMRAQGMQIREVRLLVLAESGISATLGTAVGLLVGIGMASQFVQVLRPIFTLSPPLEVPVFELGILAVIVLGASALSSLAAAILIGRLKPTELLRDE